MIHHHVSFVTPLLLPTLPPAGAAFNNLASNMPISHISSILLVSPRQPTVIIADVFEHSDKGLLFMLFFLFGLNVIAFSFLVWYV